MHGKAFPKYSNNVTLITLELRALERHHLCRIECQVQSKF